MSSHPDRTPDHLQGPMAKPTPLGRDESRQVYRCKYCLVTAETRSELRASHLPGCKHPTEEP